MKRTLLVLFALALAGTIVLLGTPAVKAQESATVSVDDNVFSPAAVTIDVGGTVTWNWTGSNPHTVTADDGSFASAQQTSGSFSRTFNTAGTFSYFCEVHGQSMSGSVTVNAAGGGEPTAVAPTRVAANGGVATPTTAAAAPTTAGGAGTAVAAPDTGTGSGPGNGDNSLMLLALTLAVGAVAAGAGTLLLRRGA